MYGKNAVRTDSNVMKTSAVLASFSPFIFAISTFGQASGLVRDGSPDSTFSTAVAVSQNGSTLPPSRLFVHVGITGILYHTSATVLANEVVIPGASVSTVNQYTLTADVGSFLTRHVSIALLAGVPVKQALHGAGSASTFGVLGSVRYGAIIASADYHLNLHGRFQPYLGGGAAYAVIFKNYDGAIAHLKVPDHLGYALQFGAEYRVNRKLGFFADFKQVFLTNQASGEIEGGLPARSRITSSPSLPTAGIAYSF